MDITSTTATTTIKTPEAESETPTRIQPKPLSFSNGVLKRTQPVHHHHLHHHHAVVVIYKECLKNHAASMGGHAVDGCGEFMPSPNANPTDPTSLKCAACGCHRNFHRREPEEPPIPPPISTAALEYQPHHRHHPPPPHRGGNSSPSSASPPPISSSYYPSAPHMLLALSTGLSAPPPTDNTTPISAAANTLASANGCRKRFRTKFTQDQKDKMLEFAERVGWKMQKRDEDLISDFCNEIGVEKGVLKVWMHNNKSTLGKKDHNSNPTNTTNATSLNYGNGNGNGIAFGTAAATASTHYHHQHHHDDGGNSNKNDNGQELSQHSLHNRVDSVSAHVVATNGGSSSSS